MLAVARYPSIFSIYRRLAGLATLHETGQDRILHHLSLENNKEEQNRNIWTNNISYVISTLLMAMGGVNGGQTHYRNWGTLLYDHYGLWDGRWDGA